jgi:calcium-dependent protein kinase
MGCGASSTVHVARPTGSDFQANLINEHSVDEKCLDTYAPVENGMLGAGAYGTVFCARHKGTSREVAIKTIQVGNGETWDNLLNEVNIMKKLRHPNIVRLYETFKTNSSIQLVMHKCSGGDLRKFLEKKHPGDEMSPQYETRVARMISKVLAAVAYMHHRKVCHRDLKLENIMLETDADDSEIVVMDFGLGEILQRNDRLNDSTGTLPYMAPEMLSDAVPYDFECDIWAVGIILFELLATTLPFHNGMDPESLHSIKAKIDNPDDKLFCQPIWKTVSPEAKACILQLCKFNPNQRPTAEQAHTCEWLIRHHDPNEEFIHFKDTDEKAQKLVTDLKQFSKFEDLKRAALISAAFGLDENMVDDLKHEFNMIDSNNNGRITQEELKKLMELDHEHVLKEEEVKAVFDAIDQDHDGTINWLEFLAASTHSINLLQQQHWTEAFKLLDIDNTGSISKENVAMVLGRAAKKDQADKILDDFDVNGDGKVTFEEFMQMVDQLHQPEPDGPAAV